MAQSVISGDLVVTGACRFGSLTVPNSSVGNTQFSSTDLLSADKQNHQFVKLFTQVSGSIATAETRAIHSAYAAGTVIGVAVGSVVAATGNSTVTVDVRKNGTTILSATIVLDNANTAYVVETGTISTAAYSAGDTFTVVQTVSAGTGTLPQGVFVRLVLQEAPA